MVSQSQFLPPKITHQWLWGRWWHSRRIQQIATVSQPCKVWAIAPPLRIEESRPVENIGSEMCVFVFVFVSGLVISKTTSSKSGKHCFTMTWRTLLLSHIGEALHMSMSTFSKLRIFEQVSVWFLNKLNHLSLKAKSHCLRSVKKVFGGKFQQRWFWAKASLSKSDFEEKQVPTKWFWAKVNFSKVILSESKILEKWFWGRATFNKVICAKARLASWKNC